MIFGQDAKLATPTFKLPTRRPPIDEASPSELLPGDLVLVDEKWAYVVEEAMTMHRGFGMFDDFELLVGARIQFVDKAGSEFRTWNPTDRVQVRRMAAQAA